MPIYTDPPEWPAEGKAPPEAKRNAGWQPRDRVPASWLNWFWNRTAESLREIAQAFVNHRDASAPHDGHETKTGATQKVQAHSDSTTGVHGVGAGYYVAKTTRPDQLIGWDDVQDKPTEFPATAHHHDDRYYTKTQGDQRYAPIQHQHGAADLPKASTSQEGIVRLTNDRTSRSETLALTARAMDDHRLSGDHDGRYYTKSQLTPIIQYLLLHHWAMSDSGTSFDLRGVAYANGLWVAVGSNGTILNSTNGTSWISRSSGTSSDLRGVAYANGLWVVVGESGTIRTSPDGTSWASRSSGTSFDLYDVTYADGLWVAVGSNGTILTSQDGTSWASRSSGTSQRLWDVAYADGLWVVVGDNGTILTSPDGISWTLRTSGATPGLRDVAYANGLWVAVGYGGTILTSTNGISWASLFINMSEYLWGVTYANGLWVVVGDSGTILTSRVLLPQS